MTASERPARVDGAAARIAPVPPKDGVQPPVTPTGAPRMDIDGNQRNAQSARPPAPPLPDALRRPAPTVSIDGGLSASSAAHATDASSIDDAPASHVVTTGSDVEPSLPTRPPMPVNPHARTPLAAPVPDLKPAPRVPHPLDRPAGREAESVFLGGARARVQTHPEHQLARIAPPEVPAAHPASGEATRAQEAGEQRGGPAPWPQAAARSASPPAEFAAPADPASAEARPAQAGTGQADTLASTTSDAGRSDITGTAAAAAADATSAATAAEGGGAGRGGADITAEAAADGEPWEGLKPFPSSLQAPSFDKSSVPYDLDRFEVQNLGEIGPYELDPVWRNSGSFGFVFRGQIPGQNPVAIKISMSSHDTRTAILAREADFQARAAEVAGGVVPALIEAGMHALPTQEFPVKTKNFGVMITEYVPGETLSRSRNNDPLTIPQIVHRYDPLAQAIVNMGEIGIVHQELSPANVIIDPDGIAHIVDFGLATTPGTVGTDILVAPICHTPEQVLGGEITPATAAFQLGLLALRDSLNRQDRLRFHLIFDETYTAYLQEFLQEVHMPPRVAQAFLHVLAENPEERPTAVEFLRELAAAGEAETASPPSPGQPPEHPGRERTLAGNPDPAADADALRNTSTREGPIQVLENGQFVSELYQGGPERYLQLQPDIESIVTAAYEQQIIARVGALHAPLYIQHAQQDIRRILDQIHDNFSRNDTNIVLLRERRGNGFVGFTYSFTNAHSPQTVEVGTTIILEEYRGLGGMALLMENLNHGITANGNYTKIMHTVPQANGYAQRVMDHVRRESGDITILSTDTEHRWFGAQTVFMSPVSRDTAAVARLETTTALAERGLTEKEIADIAITIDVLGREGLRLILTGDREAAAQIGGIIQSLLQYAGGQTNQVLEGVVEREKLMQPTRADGYRTAQVVLTEHFERNVSPEDPAYDLQRGYHEAFLHYLESKAIRKHIAETQMDRVVDYLLDPRTARKRATLWGGAAATTIFDLFNAADPHSSLLYLLVLGGGALGYTITAGRFEWKTWRKEKARLDRAKQEAEAEDINSIATNFFGYWEPYHRLATELVNARFDITEEELAGRYGARIRDGLTIDHVLYQAIMGSRNLVADPDAAMDEITRRLQWVLTFAREPEAPTRLGLAFDRKPLNIRMASSFQRGQYAATLEKLLTADNTIDGNFSLRVGNIKNLLHNMEKASTRESYDRGFKNSYYKDRFEINTEISYTDLLDAMAYTDELWALNDDPELQNSFAAIQEALTTQLQIRTKELENGSIIKSAGKITRKRKLSRAERRRLISIGVTTEAASLLDSSAFVPPQGKTTVQLVEVNANKLSVGRDPLPMDTVIAYAETLGLEPCPIWVAPSYVLQQSLLLQATKGENLSPAMHPVNLPPEGPLRFAINEALMLVAHSEMVAMSETLVFVQPDRPAQK